MKNEPKKPVYMGVDVSKDELVTAFSEAGRWKKAPVLNTEEAIEKWLKGFDTASFYFVFEATGPYSARLAHCLHRNRFAFSVVNPSQSRAMSGVLCKRTKTDDQDAQTLALLGEKMELKPFQMPDPVQKNRKEAFSALAALQKQQQMVQNQLHALSYLVGPNPAVVAAFEQVLATVELAIEQVQKELAPEQDEEEARQTVQRLATIKGIGTATAEAVVALFGNLQQFESAKSFANFIGIAPKEHASGKSVRGRRSITKKGNAQVRVMLFNCARSAMRFNPACKNLYLRIVEKGKNGRIALTAVMHKLARQIFGVARSGADFDPKLNQTKLLVA